MADEPLTTPENQPEVEDQNASVDELKALRAERERNKQLAREAKERRLEAEKLQAQIDKYKTDFGDIDPEEYKKLKEQAEKEQKERELEEATAQQTLEKQARLLEEEREQKRVYEQRLKDAEARIEAERLQGLVRDAYFRAGGRADRPMIFDKVFMPLAMKHFRELDGELVPVDPDTARATTDASTGKRQNASQKFRELSEQYPEFEDLFIAPRTSGAGVSGASSYGEGPTTLQDIARKLNLPFNPDMG